jgi:hypothetical protein
MKRIFLALLTVALLSATALASKPEVLTLKTGQQKRAGKGEITIKFLSVEEDSRCPEKAACVWQGNARIKVRIGFRKGESKVVEMNSDMGPKGDQIGGWAIYLTSLTPKPLGKNASRQRYHATFEISRMTR